MAAWQVYLVNGDSLHVQGDDAVSVANRVAREGLLVYPAQIRQYGVVYPTAILKSEDTEFSGSGE
jgi:hypothetical protein